MPRSASVLALVLPLLAAPIAAVAQDHAAGDPEKLGSRLFNQSCVLCHKNPQINSAQYGPTLSMTTLGGKADLMREVISNGTPRMPGFKTQFTPTQIDGIVAYIKTITAPAAPAATPSKARGPGEAD